jgi:hypothetical protein
MYSLEYTKIPKVCFATRQGDDVSRTRKSIINAITISEAKMTFKFIVAKMRSNVVYNDVNPDRCCKNIIPD